MEVLVYLVNCLISLFSDPIYASISYAALVLAIATALAMRRKNLNAQNTIRLTYTHLAMLLLPLALFTRYMPCNGNQGICGIITTFSNVIISALVSIIVVGYLFFPLIYPILYRANRKSDGLLFNKLTDLSAKLRVKTPKLFIFDSGLPSAFSVSGLMPAIFISVGMQEILEDKEIDAVLLHELNHLTNSAPNLRFLLKIAQVFSPFYAIMNINPILATEERKADTFVLTAQGSSRYLNSAKNKTELEF